MAYLLLVASLYSSTLVLFLHPSMLFFFCIQNLLMASHFPQKEITSRVFKMTQKSCIIPASSFSDFLDLSSCSFPLSLLCSSHNCLLSVALVLQAHSCPRAFALVIPSAWNTFRQRTAWHTLISFGTVF